MLFRSQCYLDMFVVLNVDFLFLLFQPHISDGTLQGPLNNDHKYVIICVKAFIIIYLID